MSETDKLIEREKIAFEHLKTIGLFDKFKESLKNAPQGSTVCFSDDGHVLILGEIGEKFLKKPRIFFDSEHPDGEFKAKSMPVLEKIKRKSRYISRSLQDEGYSIVPMPDIRLELRDMGDAKWLSKHCQERKMTKTQRDLKIKYLETALIALDTGRYPCEILEAVYELGVIEHSLSVYSEYSSSQKKAAKKERKPVLNKIINKLAINDDSAKELWRLFYGMLDEEFHNVRESNTERRYTYTDHNEKEQSISFTTFSNKLSEAKKRK